MSLTEYTDNEILAELQVRISRRYKRRAFTAGPTTCFIGLVEELGEIAEVMLLNRSDYRAVAGKREMEHDGLGHEVGDLIVYALSLCNTSGVSATFSDSSRPLEAQPPVSEL